MRSSRFFIIFLCLTLCLSSRFAAGEIPYSGRPGIDSVSALSYADAGKNPPHQSWEKVKKSFAAFTAELLATYPEQQFYFLARDSEYLYDTAQVLLDKKPALRKRLHLLPLSRLNVNNQNVVGFLSQEGLDAHHLKKSGAVLIDLGWRGTIPNSIRALLGGVNNVVTQLVTSQSKNGIPSSRVFLQQLVGKSVNLSVPDAHHRDIVAIEHLSHYHSRPDDIANTQNRWEVYSPGHDKPSVAVEIMQDLKAYAMDPKVRQWFQTIKEDMSAIAQAARGEGSATAQELADRFQRLRENNVDYFLQDLQEMANLNFPHLGLSTPGLQGVIQAESLPGDSTRLAVSHQPVKETPPLLKDLTSGVLAKGTLIKLPKKNIEILGEFPRKKMRTLSWYRAKDEDGSPLVFTLPTVGFSADPALQKELDQIRKRNKRLQELSLPVLKTEGGNGYVLQNLPKSYKTGREWLKDWEANPVSGYKGVLALAQFLEALSRAGLYVGELTRDQMIFDGKHWFIVDAGAMSKGDATKIAERYIEKIGDRWSKLLKDGLRQHFASCGYTLRKISQ